MLLPIKDMAGNQTGEMEVSDVVFNGPVRPDLMHQALVRQQANARAGTHKTKNRSEVAGGGRKPWRQKGTGRARQGSIRSPQWKGGGVVFGPSPRSYTQSMPRKMRRAAVRSALSVKARAGQIVIIDGLMMEQPKTKAAVEMLNNLGASGQSVLVVLADRDMAIERSFSNLPKTKTLLGGYLNVKDLLGYDMVVFSISAVEPVESWLDVEVADVIDAIVDEAVTSSVTEPAAETAGE